MAKGLVLISLVLLVAFAAGVVGARVGESYYEKVELFQQVIDYVSERYVEELLPDDLVLKAVKGMLGNLDPHSQFLSPDDYRELMVDTKGKFGGIGIEIGVRNQMLTVIAPLEGTPAHRLGIHAGDRIVAIEGESTKGWTSTDAVKRLRGPKDTKVTITVAREGLDETLDFTIVRDIINVKSVPYAFKLDPDVGYIRLSTFSEESAEEILKSVDRLKAENCRALILDLRYNPGGLLTQAVQVSEIFLEKGLTIVSIRGRDESQNTTYNATRDDSETALPIVVLINQFSASASEIVAGALQDHDRGVILGETSFGKGSVQTLFALEGGYALKLTTAKYFTPSGRSIHKDEENFEGMFAREEVTEEEAEPAEKFSTDRGRTVYGGGGIHPDFTVEPRKLTEVEQELLKKPVFFNFAIYYQSLHSEVSPDFMVTPEIIEDFRKRVNEVEGIGVSVEDVEEARELVETRLTYEILRAFHGEAVARQRVIETDTEITKAVDFIKRGKSLEGMLALASEMQTQNEEEKVVPAD